MNKLNLLKEFLVEQQAHLIPKKVPVHLKTGRVIEGIRWIRPEKFDNSKFKITIHPKYNKFHALNLIQTLKKTLKSTHTQFISEIDFSQHHGGQWSKVFYSRLDEYVGPPEERGYNARTLIGADGKSRIQLSQGTGISILVHEIGHTIWFGTEDTEKIGSTMSNLPNEFTNQIIDAYGLAKESNSGFPSNYAKFGSGEFFAECYAAFVLYNDKFKQRNPEMYKIMGDIFRYLG